MIFLLGVLTATLGKECEFAEKENQANAPTKMHNLEDEVAKRKVLCALWKKDYVTHM